MVSNEIGYTTLTKEFAQKYINEDKLIILDSTKTYDITPILAWYARPEMPKYIAEIIKSIT